MYARRKVKSRVTKANAYHHTLHTNQWPRLWEILAIHVVKSNITTVIYVCGLIVNMFYCGRNLLNSFKQADIKGVS